MRGIYLWCVMRECVKKKSSNLTHTYDAGMRLSGKKFVIWRMAVYWCPLHDESHSNPFSHSSNANIWRTFINNHLDEITNHRYLWSVCFDVCQFTANLANQIRQMNEWHIHLNHTHFFIHTMCESWCMTHHEYVPCIVWTQLTVPLKFPILVSKFTQNSANFLNIFSKFLL